MRTLWRHRAGLVAQASSAIQRMQKASIEMNIQLSHVLSDRSGLSGMAIREAILAGERAPRKLATLADPQVKASEAVIAKSWEGNWRPELLFVLGQEMEIYRGCQQRMGACDQQSRQHLQGMESKVDPQVQPLGPRPKGKRARGNAPLFDLRTELYRLTGVDCRQVDGIDVQMAQTVIADVGGRLDAFLREKHFASWLELCPTNETSGGKVLKRRTPKVVNRAKVAFRQAATTLLKSKLACLFYRLPTKGQQYVDKGSAYYETRHREQQVRALPRRASQLGLEVLFDPGRNGMTVSQWLLESACATAEAQNEE